MTKDTLVTGKIIPIDNGTRLRTSPQTYSTVVNSYSAGTQVEIDQTLLYEANDPVQTAIWKNDLWGRVIKVNGVAPKWSNGALVTSPVYMAIDYHGAPVCTKQYSDTLPPVDPPTGEIEITDSIVNYVVNGVIFSQRMIPDGPPIATG